MRTLAIDCSVTPGSLAVLDGSQCCERLTLGLDRRTAQLLTPAMGELLTRAGWRPADVQLVAVTTGPGSFTGLRVGVTAAKTFAYAAGCSLRGINTLRVLAQQAFAALPELRNHFGLHAIMDAQRGELFVGQFSVANGDLSWDESVAILDRTRWMADLPERVVVCGPVLNKLVEKLPPLAIVPPPEGWMPDAATAGQLAANDFAAGRCDDVWTLAPTYYRRSAAEEKLAGRTAPSE